MRIVLLTTLAPAGPPSGGVYVTLGISRALSGYGRVEKWAVWSLGNEPNEGGEWRGTLPISLGRLRGHGVLRAVSRLLPLSVGRFYRTDFAALLSRTPPADLLFVDHVAMSQYVDVVAARRIVICSYNVEAEIYKRAVALERSRLKRAVWLYEANMMRRYEEAALRRADAVVCLGDRDRRLLHDFYGVDAEVWYPSVANARPVAERASRGLCLGSVGTMTWQPNRWGMDWFVRDVWPLVRQRVSAARIRLAGRGSEDLPYDGVGGVERVGMVDDLIDFYDDVDVFVAPVRGGGGIKIKVMDAAARGLPVVTTSSGVEGLGEKLPTAIRVADDPDSFAEEVCRLLQSRPRLPIAENIAWYQGLVKGGADAIARVIAPLG